MFNFVPSSVTRTCRIRFSLSDSQGRAIWTDTVRALIQKPSGRGRVSEFLWVFVVCGRFPASVPTPLALFQSLLAIYVDEFALFPAR